jgi:C-terminal processing protease CtpA/Prc
VTLTDSRGGTSAAQGLQVLQVAQGSEAERGGLSAGDAILSIDRAAPASVNDAIRRLSGPDGSDVVVEVQRGEGRTTLRIRRERVRR